MGAENTIRESVVVEFQNPRPNLTSFDAVINKLAAVEKYVNQVNRALEGVSFSSLGRKKAEWEALFKMRGAKGAMSTKDIESITGISLRELDAFAAALRLRQKKISETMFRSTGNLASPAKAGEFVERFHADLERTVRQKFGKVAPMNLADLLTPKISTVTGQGAATQGNIPLAIPGSQILARVEGVVNLVVPASQITGVATGVSGGGGGPGSTSKKARPVTSLSTLARERTPTGEYERVRAETESGVTETVKGFNKLGQTLAQTFDSMEREISRRITTRTGSTPIEQFRQQKAMWQEQFRESRARSGKDLGALSAEQHAAAQRLGGLMSPEMESILGPHRAREIKQQLAAKAETLERQSALNAFAAARSAKTFQRYDVLGSISSQGAQTAAERDLEQLAREKSLAASRKRPLYSKAEVALADDHEARRQKAEAEQLAERRRREATRVEQANLFYKLRTTPPPLPPPVPKTPPTFMQRIGGQIKESFGPEGFAMHAIKGAGWMAAITAVMKAADLASYSLQRMTEVGLQTRRLDQVFRGVGGSAKDLADDTLGLAAAEGRATREGLDSAIQWSRLGGTRRDVDMEVRASLVAANVAEMDAADSTERLSAVTSIYNLQARELMGVLGMLNNTSNTYKASNKELFAGLEKSASLAKAGGMGLAELQGMVGSMVGKGNTGSQSGNAIKTIMTHLNDPSIQDTLRSRFGLSMRGADGQQKNISERIGDIWVAYQGMTSKERGILTKEVAGATQANRFAAMMTNWVKAQKLAIDGLENLNSAEIENAKITGSLAAQWQGLKTAFDRALPTGLERGGANFLRLGANIANSFSGPSLLTRFAMSLSKNHPNLAMIPGAAGWMQDTAGGGTLGDRMMNSMPRLKIAMYTAGYLADKMQEIPKTDARQYAESKYEAADLRFNLLKRHEEALGKVRGRDLSTFGAGIADMTGSPALFGAMADRGDRSGMHKMLELAEATQLHEKYIALKQSQIAINEAKAEGLQITEKEKQVAEEVAEELQTIARQIDESQQGISFKTGTQMGAADIASRLGGLNITGRERNTVQAQLLEQEAAYLQERIQYGQDHDFNVDEFKQRRRQVLSESEYLRSPNARAQATRQDDIQRSNMFRQMRYDTMGTGADPVEQSVDRHNQLLEEQHRLKQLSIRTDADNLRILQNAHDLMQSQLDIERKVLETNQQIANLRKQADRDTANRLLTAGPAQMLQMAAAARLRATGQAASGFFGFGAGMRQELLAQGGGTQMLDLFRDRHALQGRGMTPNQFNDWSKNNYGYGNQFMEAAKNVVKDALVETAKLAAGFNLVTDSIAGLPDKFYQLADGVGQLLRTMHANSTVTSPKIDIGVSPGSGGLPGLHRIPVF